MVIASIVTMTITPIMTRVLNVWDIPLAIVGYCINLTVNLIKGSWLSENGKNFFFYKIQLCQYSSSPIHSFPAYYSCMAVGALGGIASICTRSHVAKIVDRNEQGKMMGVMAIMDTISPVIATTIFSQIFRVTVNTSPGTVYYVIAGLILIPITVMIWIALRTERQAIDGINNDLLSNQQQQQNEDVRFDASDS